MDKVFGAGTVVQFSPEILERNAGNFGTVSGSPGLDLRDCF